MRLECKTNGVTCLKIQKLICLVKVCLPLMNTVNFVVGCLRGRAQSHKQLSGLRLATLTRCKKHRFGRKRRKTPWIQKVGSACGRIFLKKKKTNEKHFCYEHFLDTGGGPWGKHWPPQDDQKPCFSNLALLDLKTRFVSLTGLIAKSPRERDREREREVAECWLCRHVKVPSRPASSISEEIPDCEPRPVVRS